MAGRFSVDSIDVGPDDLAGQLPAFGRLLRFIAGPDRPDYLLAELETPIRHDTTLERLRSAGVDLTRVDPEVVKAAADGAVALTVQVIVMAARIVGQQVHRGMVGLPVNVAYALSGAVHAAERLDFALCLPVAVGFVTDRDPPSPPAPSAPSG
jgi:hypothetical protein